MGCVHVYVIFVYNNYNFFLLKQVFQQGALPVLNMSISPVPKENKYFPWSKPKQRFDNHHLPYI